MGMNIYLIFNEGSNVKRVTSIEGWSKVKNHDLQQKIEKKGVLVPEEEYTLYFDKREGIFEQFLVKKGERIQVGTPLYEFSPNQIEEERERLEFELNKLEGQIQDIEWNIEKLKDYQETVDSSENEETNSELLIANVEKDIYEKELQRDLIIQESVKVEKQLGALDEKLNEVTLLSPYDGIIKDINEGLSNPIITISSSYPAVKGVLLEKERQAVTDSMKAIVTSKTDHIKFETYVTAVEDLPNTEPAIEGESQYSFYLQLDEQAAPLNIGSHVGIEIITEEVLGVPAINKQSIVKGKNMKEYVWVVNAGILEKREIQAGLIVGEMVQMSSGIQKGDIIIKQPENLTIRGTKATFTTPLHIKFLSKEVIATKGKKDLLKYILKGFVTM
jgi:HlyD family secretion protein